MNKTKKKKTIEQARADAWKKINQRAEETVARNKRGECPEPKIKFDPNRKTESNGEWDNYSGDADLIMQHAERCCKDNKERLQYLHWALDSISLLPKFHLWEAQYEEEKRRDAIERMKNPVRFDTWNSYYKQDDPRDILRAEIDRLEGRGGKPRKAQGVNVNYLLKYKNDPEHVHVCSTLRRQLNVSESTWNNWKAAGKRIAHAHEGRMKEWQDRGYDSSGKSLLLKTCGTQGRQTKQKFIWDFLYFTGEMD